ncbi:4-hydroxy-tetrahydrodipicolinate reductase [Chitinilyticum litopenaei]|uniref:4-hydroxy-tetrahydrodipicolinate reductase n=1 Tax=Chitinilyticum litopenaei TaxID=1121276 RepID=UPI00040228E4|nr:dihydrodipicolinate reductase C-terminal domain-containing protein [Chitinilyticum litopenaei]
MLRIGLIGFGKAGRAVAEVLQEHPDLDLAWIARRSPPRPTDPLPHLQQSCTSQTDYAHLFDCQPVDALIDFSSPDSIALYGSAAAARGIAIVSANSAHSDAQLALARELGRSTRVLCSPNITLGINFLLIAAKALKKIAPWVDIAIVEEHFRTKHEVSGTARRLAHALDVDEASITSLRLGGVVGHHEVVFGFPHQTVRLVHDSISRHAFGTGAVFALQRLLTQAPGFYQLEQLMLQHVLAELADEQPA